MIAELALLAQVGECGEGEWPCAGLKECKRIWGSLRDGEAPSSTCQPSDTLAAGKSEEGGVVRRAG